MSSLRATIRQFVLDGIRDAIDEQFPDQFPDEGIVTVVADRQATRILDTVITDYAKFEAMIKREGL
jgi:hypothetical protein